MQTLRMGNSCRLASALVGGGLAVMLGSASCSSTGDENGSAGAATLTGATGAVDVQSSALFSNPAVLNDGGSEPDLQILFYPEQAGISCSGLPFTSAATLDLLDVTADGLPGKTVDISSGQLILERTGYAGAAGELFSSSGSVTFAGSPDQLTGTIDTMVISVDGLTTFHVVGSFVAPLCSQD